MLQPLLVRMPVGHLSSWLLISLKPKEIFESSALLLHLAEFGQGSNLAGDRKTNSSKETEQRHKPVSSKKRKLNIIFYLQAIFLVVW